MNSTGKIIGALVLFGGGAYGISRLLNTSNTGDKTSITVTGVNPPKIKNGALVLSVNVAFDNPTNHTMSLKKPNLSAFYALPLLFAGGGIIIAAATDANSKAKYLGYGLAVAGGFEGIKIIPVAKDYLSGILGETEIPAASAFYTESEEREKLMNGFGLSALPVGNASMQEVASIQSNLPDLEGSENTGNEDLGYNASQTDDEEVRGIL